MADIHIDEFYRDCAKTLVHLYACFPRLTSLYIDDLIGKLETDEYGIPSRRHQACFDTLLWLAAEGYIRYHDRVRQDGLDQVVLTEKSFTRLSTAASFATMEPIPVGASRCQASLAWSLREALHTGSSNTINQATVRFFSKL